MSTPLRTGRTRTGLGAGLLAIVLASTLTACSSTGITAGRVDHAMGPAFARLYVQQQHQLGKVLNVRPQDFARCRRNDASSPTRGAGDDWSCTVNYPFADGHIQPIVYDLQVQPSGCFTADGPTQIVGPQHERAADGSTVTNPLFEFDACFDVT